MSRVALNAVLCLFLGATLVGCGREQATTAPRPALSVTVAQVESRPLQRTIVASGSVAAWEELPVGSEVSGLSITQVLVDEGDTVKKGQLLAKLNDSVLQAQMRQQEANVEAARASFVQAQADLKRAQDLRKQGVVSVQAEDSSLAVARTAAATLVSRQGALAETQARLAQTQITAPADGYISSRSAVIGQIVSAGTELFRIVRDGQLELRADVPETQLSRLKAGLTADVTADGVNPTVGTIRLVSPSVDTRTRLGMVYVTLPMGSGLRPGMFARASIKTDPSPAMVVPQKAIAYRDSKSGVFSVSADNVVTFTPVDTGARMDDEVEIVSGVSIGEEIVVTGAGLLEDGDLVQIVSEQAQNTHIRLTE
jgi:RND family efflux transporter MFP subunit